MCRETLKGLDGKSSNPVQGGICMGYVNAAINAYLTFSKESNLFCVPERVTVAQEVKMFVQYVDQHPEITHEHAEVGIIPGVLAAFPCKK